MKTFPYKIFFAEFVGTYLLTAMVLHSIGMGDAFFMGTPFVAALTLGLMVATIGPVSGCHINPAVTIALAFSKKTSWSSVWVYILAQVLGALAARMIIPLLIDVTFPSGAIMFEAVLGEIFGAGVLMWGISSVVYEKANAQLAPFIIGGSLLLGIAGAVPHSLGVLNPAVALALFGLNPIYLVSPIVGTVIGSFVYSKLLK